MSSLLSHFQQDIQRRKNFHFRNFLAIGERKRGTPSRGPFETAPGAAVLRPQFRLRFSRGENLYQTQASNLEGRKFCSNTFRHSYLRAFTFFNEKRQSNKSTA